MIPYNAHTDGGATRSVPERGLTGFQRLVMITLEHRRNQMALENHIWKIVGDFDLLTHNPANMRRPTETGAVKGKKIPTADAEAEAGLYPLKDGTYAFPSVGCRSSLLNGLKNKKVGKASAISVFQAAVFNDTEWCQLLDRKTEKPLKEYTVDSRRAVVQRQGIIRSRPRFSEWMFKLDLLVDTEMVSVDQVTDNLNVAGKIIGIGDFRVEKRGPFGRFHAELVE
jgi:hypothetical protein